MVREWTCKGMGDCRQDKSLPCSWLITCGIVLDRRYFTIMAIININSHKIVILQTDEQHNGMKAWCV